MRRGRGVRRTSSPSKALLHISLMLKSRVHSSCSNLASNMLQALGVRKSAADEPSNRVAASLRALFRELSAGTDGESVGPAGGGGGADDGAGGRAGVGAAGGNGGTGTSSASVEALRTALAELSNTFPSRNMYDAADALDKILGEQNATIHRRLRHARSSIVRMTMLPSPPTSGVSDESVIIAIVMRTRSWDKWSTCATVPFFF